jgi:hypothetical protein
MTLLHISETGSNEMNNQLTFADKKISNLKHLIRGGAVFALTACASNPANSEGNKVTAHQESTTASSQTLEKINGLDISFTRENQPFVYKLIEENKSLEKDLVALLNIIIDRNKAELLSEALVNKNFTPEVNKILSDLADNQKSLTILTTPELANFMVKAISESQNKQTTKAELPAYLLEEDPDFGGAMHTNVVNFFNKYPENQTSILALIEELAKLSGKNTDEGKAKSIDGSIGTLINGGFTDYLKDAINNMQPNLAVKLPPKINPTLDKMIVKAQSEIKLANTQDKLAKSKTELAESKTGLEEATDVSIESTNNLKKVFDIVKK